jgi:site-specific recombinase XerD
LTRVRNNAFRESRETVIEDNELNRALDQANGINNEYFRLRALAVLSLLRLSGKRRTEISWIPLENFKVENNLLNVTFALEKKKGKHRRLVCVHASVRSMRERNNLGEFSTHDIVEIRVEVAAELSD